MQTEMLQNANASAAADALDPTLKKLRTSVDKVVGSVFYGTLLKTMRASPLKGKFGHGGRGEEVFSAQLDQMLAEKAGQARRYSLNDALYEHLARQPTRTTSTRPSLSGPKFTTAWQADGGQAR
jgi:Rod binding domain-containing protein